MSRHQRRRDRLRAAQRCINGPNDPACSRGEVVHGEVVKAGKCQRCIDVHKLTQDRVRAMPPACSGDMYAGVPIAAYRGGVGAGFREPTEGERSLDILRKAGLL